MEMEKQETSFLEGFPSPFLVSKNLGEAASQRYQKTKESLKNTFRPSSTTILQSDDINPFKRYEKFLEKSQAQNAFVDTMQLSFNATAAVIAVLSLTSSVPAIGVALACLGTVCCKIFSLFKDNNEFRLLLIEIDFILKTLEEVNPCPENSVGLPVLQTRPCIYVSQHLQNITTILLNYGKKLEQRITSITPASYINEIVKELSLMNAGLTLILLDAKLQGEKVAVAAPQATVVGEEEVVFDNKNNISYGGGPLDLDNDVLQVEVVNALKQLTQEVKQIVRDNPNIVESDKKGGGTRRRRNKNKRRTRRNKRRTRRNKRK